MSRFGLGVSALAAPHGLAKRHGGRRLGFVVLLALTTLALAVAAVHAPPASAAENGVVPDLTWGTSSADQDRTAAAISDLGAQWVQLNIDWGAAEPTQGTYDQATFDTLDRAVALARQAGAKVELVVEGTPSWDAAYPVDPSCVGCVAPPKDPDLYAKFLSDVVTRYKGQVAAYEIRKEENIYRFWYTATGPNASEYVPFLKAGHDAVKNIDPTALVVFGGLALNDYNYLEAAYAAAPDLGKYFDVLATHPYTPDPPETIRYDSNGRIAMDSFPGYRELRATMMAHGDGNPIWLTEFGWSTNGPDPHKVTEAQQADYLTRAYAFLAQDPYVQVALWYNLRNNWWESDAGNWGAQLGLMRTDFCPKPAYAAFRMLNRSDPAAPSPCDPPASPAPAPSTGVLPTPPAPSGTPAQKTSVTLSVTLGRVSSRGSTRRTVIRRRRFSVTGTVRRAHAGRVIVYLERLSGARPRWRQILRLTTTVRKSGLFTRTVVSQTGRFRVHAAYLGAPGLARSASRLVYFRWPAPLGDCRRHRPAKARTSRRSSSASTTPTSSPVACKRSRRRSTATGSRSWSWTTPRTTAPRKRRRRRRHPHRSSGSRPTSASPVPTMSASPKRVADTSPWSTATHSPTQARSTA